MLLNVVLELSGFRTRGPCNGIVGSAVDIRLREPGQGPWKGGITPWQSSGLGRWNPFGFP